MDTFLLVPNKFSSRSLPESCIWIIWLKNHYTKHMQFFGENFRFYLPEYVKTHHCAAYKFGLSESERKRLGMKRQHPAAPILYFSFNIGSFRKHVFHWPCVASLYGQTTWKALLYKPISCTKRPESKNLAASEPLVSYMRSKPSSKHEVTGLSLESERNAKRHCKENLKLWTKFWNISGKQKELLSNRNSERRVAEIAAMANLNTVYEWNVREISEFYEVLDDVKQQAL